MNNPLNNKKLSKFTVLMKATELGQTEIIAENEEEAKELALEAKQNGQIIWEDRECEIQFIEKIS